MGRQASPFGDSICSCKSAWWNFAAITWTTIPAAIIAWIIFIFARNAIQNWRVPAARGFALTLFIPLWLVLLDNLTVYDWFIQVNMAVGILATIFLFAFNYAVSLPESTSFMVKISGTFLTSVLSVLGVIALVITPVYISKFSPNLADHRSLLFTPNDEGGYDVTEIPFQFEENLGLRTEIATGLRSSSAPFCAAVCQPGWKLPADIWNG